MSKNVKSSVNSILSEADDKVMAYLQGITNLMTNKLKCTSNGTQHFGDDSVVMYWVLPNDYRKFVGQEASFVLDLTFTGQDFVITILPDFDIPNSNRNLGPFKKPIKTMPEVISELMEIFFHLVKASASEKYKATLN